MITIKNSRIALKNNSQLQNSLYLLMSSLVTAGFGFIFWIIAARLFNEPTVGIATTLISLSSLVSLLSLAGFDVSFVRFLPKSIKRNSYTNSGIIVSGLLSIILSIIFLVIAYISTPSLHPILSNPFTIITFIILTIASSLNLLTNSVFLAYRSVKYVLIINILFNIVKVVLPFAFISQGALGIFIAAGLAQLVGLILSIWFMKRKFHYAFKIHINSKDIKQTFHYTFTVYVASVLNLLPQTILPLLVTQQLGVASTAYYYMAFSIATIIFTIAYSAMQSAFAESSHNETQLKQNILKGTKSTLILLVPTIVAAYFLGGFILSVFGQSYATNATELLQIMSISAIAVVSYSALGAVLKISHDIASLLVTNIVYTLVIIGLTFMLVPQFGLTGIGYAWIAGNIAAVAIGTLSHILFRRRLAR